MSSFLNLEGTSHAGGGVVTPYRKLAAIVMRHRNKRILSLSAAAASSALVVSAIPLSGPYAIPLACKPTTWPAFILAALACVPLLIVRKASLTKSKPAGSTNSARLKAFFSTPSAQYTVFAHLLFSYLFTTAFLLIASRAKSDTFEFTTQIAGRPHRSLNEPFIVLFLNNAFAAAIYAILLQMSDRQSPVSYTATLGARIQQAIPLNLRKSAILAASLNLYFIAVYGVFHRYFFRFIVYSIPGGIYLRPWLLSILRHSKVTTRVTIIVALVSCLQLLVAEFINTLCDVYFSQPVQVSNYSVSANRSLLEGLASTEPYIQKLAYQELALVTSRNAERRADIFNDLKTNLYEAISRQCLLSLGQTYKTLQRRGRPPLPAQPAPTPTSSIDNNKVQKAKVINENAFKPVKPSFLQSLAAPNNLSSTAIPSILQSQVPVIAGAVQQAEEKAKEVVKNSGWTPSTISQSRIYKFLFDPLLDTEIKKVLPNIEASIGAVQALTSLLVFSITQDPYGVAARSLPQTLEAFTLLHSELEVYAEEVSKTYIEPLAQRGESASEDVKKAKDTVANQLQPLLIVLQDGIKAILEEFKDYLQDFRFPPSVARRLQRYLELAS